MKWSTVGFIEMSFWASLLIICIIILRAVILNKLPKKTLTVLWGIAVCRLLLPFSITIEKAEGLAIINSTADYFLSPVTSGGAVGLSLGKTAAYEEIISSPLPVLPVSPAKLIWFCGMFAIMVIYLIIYFKQRRRLRFSWRIKDNEHINNWLRENGHRDKDNIFYSDRITTPITCGIFKPKIYLPRSMDISNGQQLNYVLFHEYCHIRHHDNIKKILLAAVACVYWFNPFVWIMLVYASRDLEIRCDEMVLKQIGGQSRADYACSLLSIADKRKGAAIFYSGYGKNSAEERIISIMKYKKATILAVSAALVIVLGAATVFATGSNRESSAPRAASMRQSTGIKLYLNDIDEGITSLDVRGITNISSRPDFTFGFNCEDVSKIEISSINSYLNIVDFTNSLENIYDVSGEETIDFCDRTYAKKLELNFADDFSDYENIMCNWFNYDLYQWAMQDGSWKIRGIGGELGNVEVSQDISEEERLLLASGTDSNGTQGVGHVQVGGYAPELLTDTLEVSFTYKDGTVETRYMKFALSNDEQGRLKIDVNIV